MRLMIGCPVRHRDWILDRWFDHVEVAIPPDTTVQYVFVGDPNSDNWTFKIIRIRAPEAKVVAVHETRIDTRQRDWSDERIEQMVTLRNFMLAEVRAYRPDLFLSLDSDILLHPDGITTLIDAVEQGWDAVGGKCYLSPGVTCPNYGMIGRERRRIHRTDATGGLFPVDILMAVKLMTSAAYNVNYEAAASGEDEGWSRNCTAAGLKLAWDSRVTNKHVMTEDRLNVIDPRVGF